MISTTADVGSGVRVRWRCSNRASYHAKRGAEDRKLHDKGREIGDNSKGFAATEKYSFFKQKSHKDILRLYMITLPIPRAPK